MGRPKGYHSSKACNYTGVSFNRTTQKYVAQFKAGGATHYVGSYSNAKQAAYAYDFAKYHAVKSGVIGPHVKLYLNFGIPKANATMPVSVVRDALHCPGVTFCQERQKYKVSIFVNKIKHFVGGYSSRPEAVAAGLKRTKELMEIYPTNVFLKRTLNFYQKAHDAYQEYDKRMDEDIVTLLTSQELQTSCPPLLFRSTTPFVPLPADDEEWIFSAESPSLDLW